MKRAAVALTVLLPITSAANGHDLRGIGAEYAALDGATANTVRRLHDNIRAMAGRIKPKSGNEAVVERALVWKKDRITVCFFGGVPAAWDQIAKIATQWVEGTRLTFDFGSNSRKPACSSNSPADIRVSFVEDGYWSYVGTVAEMIPQEKATLNLAGMGLGRTLTDDERGIALHEFGHALGFHHEHQSPKADCANQFDWPFLYAALGMSKSEVDTNMKPLLQTTSKTGLYVTDFDRDSVMLYALPAQAFRDGARSPCFVSRKATRLSQTDRMAIRAMYPPR